jgi:hypothetical protein
VIFKRFTVSEAVEEDKGKEGEYIYEKTDSYYYK